MEGIGLGLPEGIGYADLLAPLLLLLAWIGYVLYADILRIGRGSLMALMHEQRVVWMLRMLERDNRMVDIQIVQVLIQNISFFASSTILIVGGAVAVLGAGDEARMIAAQLPFAQEGPSYLWDLKILLLVVIFVYAFFKFTWALRQFNHVAILIGGIPLNADHPAAEAHARRLALLATKAADHFNRAMRAYYFGLAALSWFVQPWLLVAASLVVLVVVWRREYRSNAVLHLNPDDAVLPPARRPGSGRPP
ncbi:MAG: DUF599 domain-containing protein [Geminicoccaceae bacterium]|nr:DUF599 domain-containing protein [Geminicoccaceae bacterium]